MTAIWWIRDDQRLHNNPTLDEALAWRKKTGGRLVAVWFPEQPREVVWTEFPHPIPKLSPDRAAFELACFKSLKKSLRAYHIEAQVSTLNPIDFMETLQPEVVFYTHAAAIHERQQEEALQRLGIALQGFHARNLLKPQQVFSPDLPPTYTPFRKRIEALLGTEPFPGISTYSADASPSKSLFANTEEGARAHLYSYVSAQGAGRQYKTRRNGMLKHSDSTKLSAYLSRGLIHPQEVWNRCLEIEAAVGGCEEVYWIRFELLWREYFQWVAFSAGSNLFRPQGLKAHSVSQPQKGSPKAFELWTEGRTGDALVDAAMRELRATGYQSNRARQNAASYWIHDLKQPWRIGAAYFESMLLDYDAASNWGNWAYIAGVGNDPRPFRKFNTQKQAEQYDPEGTYRAYWSGQ